MITIDERQSEKLPGNSSLFISFSYNQEIINILKSFEVYSYNKKTHEWELPIKELSQIIDSTTFLDDISINVQEESKSVSERLKMRLNYKLEPFDYQREGITYGINHNKWLLLDGMGLGKTAQIIGIARELKALGKIKHCLIVCGINTLKSNWKKEVEKHSDETSLILGERLLKNGNTTIGGIQDRLTQLKSNIEEFFVITNIETLRNEDIVKQINNGINSFDMIVVDEIHKCKNPSSEQGKGLLKLNKATYKIGATGTLLLNNPLDAFVPLKFIDAERCTYTNFKNFYCVMGGQFNNMLLGFKNLDLLKEQIQDNSLRRTKDVLSLPPKNIIDEYVDMDDSQQKFYTNITNGVKDEVDKVNLTTSSLLAMITRLRQATVCPSILTSENISSSKLDRCVELVEEIVNNNEKVVIMSTFKDPVINLANMLKEYHPLICTGDMKDEEISNNIDKFQNDEYNKVIICTWQKMGTGITLTRASYMIHLDTAWTSAVYQQTCDRIYRIGTDRPVFIYNLICKDTIDERVLEILNDKEAIGDYIIDDKITDKGLNSLRKYISNL